MFPLLKITPFSIQMFLTCVFLRPHWSVDDPLEGRYPIALLGLGLAGEQELPVGRDDGDAVAPVVSLRGGGQAGEHRVAVLLTADEHLSTGVGVLRDESQRLYCHVYIATV